MSLPIGSYSPLPITRLVDDPINALFTDRKVYGPLTNLEPRRGILTVYGESPKAQEPAGYVDGSRYYHAKPMTLYQARMRVAGERKVQMHYTKTFTFGKGHKAERQVYSSQFDLSQ